MSVATGLKVNARDDAGRDHGAGRPKDKNNPDRAAVLHGNAPSSVTQGAPRVPVD